jgi:UDP-glucose 4-epimerase
MKDQYQIHGLDIVDPVIPVDEFYDVDITKNFKIKKQFDCVIHLAAKVRVGESELNPIDYYTTNIQGTINVLAKIKTNNFVLASTGGAKNQHNVYGMSKRAAEQVTQQFCKNHNYTIFRFYNVLGSDGIAPTNPDGLMYNLINATKTGVFNLYGDDYNTKDGSCIRDYVHVNEICHALNRAVEQPSGCIENLGHGYGYSVKEIIEIFKEVNNCNFEIKTLPKRIGDLEVSVLDNPSQYMEKIYNIDQLLKL